MLKKMTLAGLAIVASSGMAFADSNSFSEQDAVVGASASNGGIESSAAVVMPKVKAHKAQHHVKLHKNKTCHNAHKRHHNVVRSEEMYEEAYPAQVAAEDYKHEGSMSVPATTCPSCEHVAVNQGPYVGFGLGTRYNVLNSSTHPSYSGFEGTVLAGYATSFQQLYTGFELYVQDSVRMLSYPTAIGSARSTVSYGVSVLPGYLISDNVLGYVKLGAVRTRFTHNSTDVTGARTGLGFQTALNNNWDIRGEWDYTFYRKINVSAGLPRTQEFNISLLYKLAM